MDYKPATGTVFREVMRDKPLDWCKLMLGDSSNLFYSMLVNLVKDSKPDLFHKCPYEGLVDGNNIYIDASKYPSIFPSGVYRTRILFTVPNEVGVISVNVTNTCTSSIKSTF